MRNDRNYTYLGVRGFGPVGEYNSRILIMINGRRMSEAIFDQSFLCEYFILDINIINRIEYIYLAQVPLFTVLTLYLA